MAGRSLYFDYISVSLCLIALTFFLLDSEQLSLSFDRRFWLENREKMRKVAHEYWFLPISVPLPPNMAVANRFGIPMLFYMSRVKTS